MLLGLYATMISPILAIFFVEMKFLFYELKNSFSSNFLEEGMLSNRYFSHVMMPMFLRKEMFSVVVHTYPWLGKIFDSYSVLGFKHTKN